MPRRTRLRREASAVTCRWANTPAERDPAGFLAFACEALGRSPIPARDAWIRRMPEALQPLRRPDPARRSAIGGGWNAGLDHIGRFGDDHAYRAAIAPVWIGAPPREEAIDATTGSDTDRHRLDGAHRHRRHVPADLPVAGFWSLSMYRFGPDGRGFFIDNPIDRYTIGDRTRGLRREPNGSIVLKLQHTAPADGTGNRPPAPDRRFGLAWRLSEPGATLLERRHTPTGPVRDTA